LFYADRLIDRRDEAEILLGNFAYAPKKESGPMHVNCWFLAWWWMRNVERRQLNWTFFLQGT
jgi:hypothetical protein